MNKTPCDECGEATEPDYDICEDCCEHGDYDHCYCLICGADCTQDFVMKAEYASEVDR